MYFENQEITGIPMPEGDGFDTDGDGRDDTVGISDPAGGSVLLTDLDGDGAADLLTEITSAGLVTVREHTGDGQWAVVERDRLGRADDASVGFGSSGSDSAGSSVPGPAACPFPDTVVSIDPATGEWVPGLPRSHRDGPV